MNVEIKIIKGIPKEQIKKFEDKVVYNTAVFTREYTKQTNSYPYLSGKLNRSEISAPILGSNKEYGLSSGVDYAKYVWNMENVNWTNSSTEPHWYYSNFKKNSNTILYDAVTRAKKEI